MGRNARCHGRWVGLAVVMAMVGTSVASAGENSPSGGSWRLRRTTGGGSAATPPPAAPVESPSASAPNASPANTSRFGVPGAAPRGEFSDDGANVVFAPSPAPMPILSSVPAASVSRTAEPEPPAVKGRPFTPGLHLSAMKPPVGEGQEVKPMPEAVRYFDNDLFGDLPAEDSEKTVTPLLPAAAPQPIRSGVPARVPEEGRNEAVPLKDAYADAARSAASVPSVPSVPSAVAAMPAPTVLYDAEGTAMRGDGTPVSVPKTETPLPEPRAVTAAPRDRDAGDAEGSGKTMPRPPVLSAAPGPSAVALQDFGIASGSGKTAASAPTPSLSREPVGESAPPTTTTAAVVPVGAAPESMRLLVDETMAALRAAKDAEATLLKLASAESAVKADTPEPDRAKTEETVSANALSLSRSHGLVPPGGEDKSMALAEPRAITAPISDSSAPREAAVRLASTGGQGRKMPNALTTLAKPDEKVHVESAPDDAGSAGISAKVPAIPEEAAPTATAKTKEDGKPLAAAPATEAVPAAPERKAPSGLADRPEYRAQADMAMARARDELVNHELLRRALDRHGLAIAEGDLEARLRARVARWSANNAWPADLDAFVETRTGMSAEAYTRRVLWPELALRRLVAAERDPSDAELERFYGDHLALFAEPESVRVSHIVVSPMALASGRSATVRVAGVEDWERARRLAEEAHAALRAGGDFADVARLRSHDARTSSRGGDLGWIEHGQLMRQLENEAFGLRPGAYSAPIRTPMGYHILRVTERREARTPSFAEARDKVVASWSERTFLNRSVALMQGLRAAAKANGDLPEPGF